MRFATIAAAILITPLALTAPVDAAGPVPLLSHRAVYEMDLGHTGHGSDLTTLDGRMVLEWAATCEGYTTTQRLITRSTDNQGQDSFADFLASTWESRDGHAMRFAARQQMNGTAIQEYLGSARLGPGKAGGSAIYTKPQPETVALPPGTAFPTQEINHILAAARQGQRTASDVVFDGSGETPLYQADAFITPVPKSQGPDPAGAEVLGDMRSWRVEVSYFPYGAKDGLPEYEIVFRLYDNGVSTDLLLDYGKMAIKGRLIGLTALPQQKC